MTPALTTPFRGTQPFEPTEEDRGRFFGRDREIEALVSLTFSQRMVLVYAQSGAGKTSLWNAGVTPALRERGFDVLPMSRPGGELPEGLGERPVANEYVLRALLALDPEADGKSLAQATLPSFLAELPRDRNPLGPVPRVFAVDQFEELFGDPSEQGLALQRDFFGQLLASLDRDDLLRVVLLLREDFLAELDAVAEPPLPARFRLEKLDTDAALDAVVKPVERAGRRFAEGAATALVEKLRMVRAPGASWSTSREVRGLYVEPVQLQAVCARLWSHLPRERDVIGTEDVERYGNVDAALGELYEDGIAKAVRSGEADEAGVREWFARELITPMRTRGTVVQKKHDTGGLPNEVVAVLESEHLVRAEPRAAARWYELAHDRLIDPILSSNERWLGSEANQLTRLAAEWERLGRDRGALLRGRKLEELGKWAESKGDLLGPREREFLRRSQAAHWVQRLRLAAVTLGPFVPLAITLYALIAVWPAVAAAAAPGEDPVTVTVFGLRWRPNPDVALLTMVALAAGVGGLARATVSIADYAWNPSASFDRVVMHLLYALAGVALSVMLYFAIRGAFITTNELNPYGIGALSGLVGLFADQAVGKLRQVFDAMFRPDPGAARPPPALHAVAPDALKVGDTAVELDLLGQGFQPDAVAQVRRPPKDPEPRPTKYVDPGRLRLRLLPEDVAEPGWLEVSVHDPGPDGGWSRPLDVEVRGRVDADVGPELMT